MDPRKLSVQESHQVSYYLIFIFNEKETSAVMRHSFSISDVMKSLRISKSQLRHFSLAYVKEIK